MEIVTTKNAVGMALGHDITRIVPSEFKGPLFKKGHIITEEDVPKLLDVGKEHIYVWNLKDGFVHEDEAAKRIAHAVVGSNIELTDVVEGKVEFVAACDGLLKINRELLSTVNNMQDIAVATLHGNHTVTKGKKLGGTRIIPLVIREEPLANLEAVCSQPIIEIIPFKKWKVGLIVTGSEVYAGRIEDGFGPVIEKKMAALNGTIIAKTFVPDSIDVTAEKILEMKAAGAEMIILTGGMSVDPDDLTPASIRKSGAETLVYGVPVLPGAMFMLAYLGDIPVMGLPGCVMYHRASIFDLVVPRIMAGEKLEKKDFFELAYGGFCLRCPECTYPDCSFGKR